MSTAPPPYGTPSQEADTQDLVTEINNLSEQTLKVDKKFADVQGVLERDGHLGPEMRGRWRDIHKVFTDLLWAARRTATEVGAYNRDFVDVIIPVVAEPSETTSDKIAELNAFINKSPPKMLTETEATEKITHLKAFIADFAKEHYERVEARIAEENDEIKKLESEKEAQKAEAERKSHNSGFLGMLGLSQHTPPRDNSAEYDYRIEQAQTNIAALTAQQKEVRDSTKSVEESLEGVAACVGKSFATVWTHVNKAAKDMKARLEEGGDSSALDIDGTARMYKNIQQALIYYSTNVSRR